MDIRRSSGCGTGDTLEVEVKLYSLFTGDAGRRRRKGLPHVVHVASDGRLDAMRSQCCIFRDSLWVVGATSISVAYVEVELVEQHQVTREE